MVRWKARTARGASRSKRCGPAKDHFVARLAGVADRDAAEKLTNLKLYVSRDRLPPIEDDETFYHADLVGLAAVDAGRHAARHGDARSSTSAPAISSKSSRRAAASR